MKLSKTKYIGILFAVLGLSFGIAFAIPIEFNKNPQIWFTPAYYTQFLPLYIAVMLLLSGIFIFGRFSQANLYLAIFGHTASEEILISWIGLSVTPLPLFAVIVFAPLSIITLWMAYANILKHKRLSVGEAIFGIALSIAFIFAPRYL